MGPEETGNQEYELASNQLSNQIKKHMENRKSLFFSGIALIISSAAAVVSVLSVFL